MKALDDDVMFDDVGIDVGTESNRRVVLLLVPVFLV